MAEKGIILSRRTYDRLIAAATEIERNRGRRNIAGFNRRDESGEVAIPFLCAIVNEGPDAEPDYPGNSGRYWARPIQIRQFPDQGFPEEPDDELDRFQFIGDAITVTNLSELRVYNTAAQPGYGGRRMLAPGQLVGVWTETDSAGVQRNVCAEHPYQMAMVLVQGPGTGPFADKFGWYQAIEYQPMQQAGLWNPTGGGPVSNYSGNVGIPAVVKHLAERGADGSGNYAVRLRPGYHIGIRWGWTDPAVTTTAHRVILVQSPMIEPFDYDSGTAEDGVKAIYDALSWAGYIGMP